MATFESVWRRVRTYCPTVDALLVRQWVQDAYATLADRHPWTFLRAELDLTLQASRTLTVTTTPGSTTLTSVAGFVSGDAGRQFRVEGAMPIYTIVTFTDANTVVLDRAYQGTSGAVTGRILDAFVLVPQDFSGFLSANDPTQTGRRVAWGMSQLELDRLDSGRTSVGYPTQMVARARSTRTAETGRLEYEYWPYAHDAARVHGLYRRRPDVLVDTAELPGVLQTRGDVLEMGARVEAARFPGTPDHPNPYYNLALSRELAKEFSLLEHGLQLRDDDLALHSWDPNPLSQQSWGEGAMTDEVARASDVSVYDVYY